MKGFGLGDFGIGNRAGKMGGTVKVPQFALPAWFVAPEEPTEHERCTYQRGEYKCGLRRTEGLDFCIAHDSSPNKDPEAFASALEMELDPPRNDIATLAQGVNPIDVALIGWVFPERKEPWEVRSRRQIRALQLDAVETYGVLRVRRSPEWVSIDGATFRASLIMDRVSTRAFFTGTSFVEFSARQADFKGTRFRDCSFDGDVSFEVATFTGDSEFIGCRFASSSSWHRADVEEQAQLRFERCIFGGPADFSRMRCRGHLALREGRALGGFSLAGLLVTGIAVVDSVKLGIADLRWIRVGSSGDLSLTRLDLREAFLARTGVADVGFDRITWPEVPGSGTTRRAVRDELAPRELDLPVLQEGNQRCGDFDPEVLEALYRGLKHNRIQSADYDLAGDFHIGEMEMKLMRLTPRHADWWPTQAYRLLSMYGERWLRPLAWAGVLLLVFAFAELFAGVRLDGRVIQYGLRGTFNPSLLATDFMDVLALGLAYAALQRPESAVPLSWASRWLQVMMGIVGPALVAFIALSLRQRFRR